MAKVEKVEIQEDDKPIIAEWTTNKGQCVKGEKVELTKEQYTHLKQKGFVK